MKALNSVQSLEIESEWTGRTWEEMAPEKESDIFLLRGCNFRLRPVGSFKGL